MRTAIQNIKPKLILIAMLVSVMISCKKDKSENPNPLSPTISIMPTSGLAGTIVTITGSGFNTDPGQDKVTFNGKAAMVQSATATTLQVTVPDTTSGPVVVNVAGKQAKGPIYTYQSLSVTGISPVQGPAGTSVTISGSGLIYNGSLQDLQPSVTFNGKLATVTSYSATKLVVTVPDSAGNGPVVVTLGTSRASVPNFYFLGVNAVSPLTGNAGTKITITGGFGPDLSQVAVTVKGNPAVINSINTSQIIATVPTGSGSGQVAVSVKGQSLPGNTFTYVAAPTVTSIYPTSGPAGISLKVTGTTFSRTPSEDIVTFNGAAAITTQASATSLTVTVPAGAATGPVKVNVNGQLATGPVFKVQTLSLISFSPMYGSEGSTITITGTGFNTTASQNQVSFNGKQATIASATATQLTVVVPAGVTTGPITVTTNGLSAASFPFTAVPFLSIGVHTIAGGTQGLTNGVGQQAQFQQPFGLAVDVMGNVFVADAGANNIRKITPDGTVSVFAGDPNGNSGSTDAKGTDARFNQPYDLVFDQQGNLYVGDYYNELIRKITPDGSVSTFAVVRNQDYPSGLAVDPSGNIYTTDNYTGTDVYEYSPTGTFLNDSYFPSATKIFGLAIDAQGNIYTSDQNSGTILKGNKQIFTFPQAGTSGITIDNNGNIIVGQSGSNTIYLFTASSNYARTPIAGGNGTGQSGYRDGALSTALFNQPVGVKVDAFGNIYVVDQGNYAIRKIVLH